MLPNEPNASAHLSLTAQRELEERLRKIRVLVAISSDKAGELVRKLFNEVGFPDIVIATDAADAMDQLRNVMIHLLVADADLQVGMRAASQSDKKSSKPGKSAVAQSTYVSGVQFIHRLRHAPNSPSPFVPALMLLEHTRESEATAARAAGVNDIVLKPMQGKDFCDRMVQVIDDPRAFITARTYRGPCRRVKAGKPPTARERRTHEIKLIRHDPMAARRA